MRRDFSKGAKKTFLNLVEDVNNGSLETIFDCFGRNPDIKDYLNDLNTYHQKVIDKNNTTKSQIERIFHNVSVVDLSYQSIFDMCSQAITDQIEYIKGF